MKNYLFNGFFFSIFLCLCSCTDQALNEKEMVQNEYPAMSVGEILDNLGKSFKPQTRSDSSQPEFVYPDYYGGGYINSAGNVVVLVKGDPSSFQNEFQTRTLSNNVILEKCDYSFNELEELNSQIIKQFENESLRDGLGWTSIGIDTEKNKIIIGLINCSEGAKNNFRDRVYNSNAIDFKEGGEGVLDASANLGGHLSYLSVAGSVGYRAKSKTYGSGFVTAGHAVPKVDGAVYLEGSYGADCKYTQYSGTFDGAFCKLLTGYSISNTTEYGKVTLKAEGALLANLKNSTIVMEGYTTKKESSGVVSEISASQSFTTALPGIGNKKYAVSNLIVSSYASAGGDSGGIVYEKSTSKIVGIHTGRLLQNNKFVNSYTSYAGTINSKFGLTFE